MRPVAPLLAEYRASALLYLVLGAAGLAGDLATRDDSSAVRSVVPFAILAAVTLALLAMTGVRWLTRAAPEAPRLPRDAAVDAAGPVWRRAAIEVLMVAILVVAGLTSRSGIGAVIAGLAFGAGLASLVGAVWISRAESARRIRLFRETPTRLITNGRRPLYSRPA